MKLRTKDLRVRDFTAADAMDLLALYTDPEVMEYLGGPFTDMDEVRDEMDCACLGERRTRYAVLLDETGEFIGEVTYVLHDEPDLDGEAEIGWALARKQWNRGYACQLTEALIEKAKGEGAKAVFLRCEEEQEVPAHIALKYGMELIGLDMGQLLYRLEF